VQNADELTLWQRWIRKPQKVWLRRALFQVHLWSGLTLGLYVLLMSITGSVLVYRNELYRAATAEPLISTGTGPRLTDDQLKEAALKLYPGYAVTRVQRPTNPDQAAELWLKKGQELKKRLFDVRTAQDLDDPVPLGIKTVSWLLDLHDNLLGGTTGRAVNGIGAFALMALTLTGIVVWWPGVKTWRRSLTVFRGIGWKRVTWHLHSAVGFWTLAFILIFAISGAYLCFPQPIENLVDQLQPPTPENAGIRIGDKIVYWLAFLHFGRINGIGIPCKGPGVCDQATKATWAFFGLAPAVMFVTGAMIWWYRVVMPRMERSRRAARAADAAATAP